MVEEAYCSLGLAKLLKEKGFDVPCRAYYWGEGNLSHSEMPNTFNDAINWYSCPTLQMVMDWLQKDKNYVIDVHLDVDEGEESTSWVWSIYEIVHPQGGEPYARLYYENDALFDLEAKNDVIEDALIYAVKFLI